jgi:hypothetical protein
MSFKRFEMAKLIEATIINGSIKLYPPVISARRWLLEGHEIIHSKIPAIPTIVKLLTGNWVKPVRVYGFLENTTKIEPTNKEGASYLFPPDPKQFQWRKPLPSSSYLTNINNTQPLVLKC